MEGIAVGMGLAPASDTEMLIDPVARLAFRKRVLEPQQQQVPILDHEQLLQEQQDQIEACKAHMLELRQMQREPAEASGTRPAANQAKRKNPALKRKYTARDQQVQQRHDVVSSTLAQQKWRKRRGYNNYDVLAERFVQFMEENTAESADPNR
ncbi:hypothetical protein BGZ95_006143, partial [Linnemannia exigua]